MVRKRVGERERKRDTETETQRDAASQRASEPASQRASEPESQRGREPESQRAREPEREGKGWERGRDLELLLQVLELRRGDPSLLLSSRPLAAPLPQLPLPLLC